MIVRRFVAAAVAALGLAGVPAGCGDEQRMPAAATTCEQLMTAAADVVPAREAQSHPTAKAAANRAVIPPSP